MKRDPFYEEDFLSEQIGKEEMNRKMKLKNFAKEKRDMYKEYVNKKEMEAQKKKEKYKSQVQSDYNKVDKTQRKWYLNSDIFNMKPLPQKEETQNIPNDNESNIKLSKEELKDFLLLNLDLPSQSLCEKLISLNKKEIVTDDVTLFVIKVI
jgi:hypothetical protein